MFLENENFSFTPKVDSSIIDLSLELDNGQRSRIGLKIY